MAYLEQRRVGTRDKRLVTLSDAGMTIGRHPDSSILLEGDQSVSSAHALLEPIGGSWFISDTGSLNGTFLNDDRVSGRRALRDCDVVRIGPWRFLFRDPSAIDRTLEETNSSYHYSVDLSDREEDVVRLVAEGLSAKEIAAALFVAESTVNGYREKIKTKTGCGSKTEVFELARRRGLV
jgi:DNA-binding CsgD family transcriptional regulator